MTKPQLFCRELLAFAECYGNRGGLRGTNDGERRAPHLDVACTKLGVARTCGALHNFAFDERDTFNSRCTRARYDILTRPSIAERELDEPLPIAEVNEQEPSEVSGSMNPSSKSNFLTNMGKPKGAAGVGAEGRGQAQAEWRVM